VNDLAVGIDQPVASDGSGSYNWTVPGGQPGGSTYKIRIIAQDTNNHEGTDVSDEFFTINPWSGKGGPPPPPDPCEYPCAPPAPTPNYTTDLLPASPNPFNPQTRLQFTLKSADDVTLRIYDIHGRLVTTVIDGQQSPGLHEALWDGRDDNGRQVASGVYFAALNANQRVFTRKLVMLK